jgi:hypothetical protein
MSHISSCARITAIALAIAALATTSASARPADLSAMYITSVPAQDLRSADAIDASTPVAQDLRSADAIDAATRKAPASQASALADTATKASAEHSAAWAAIALGIAGSLLVLGVIAGITRRTARARISA